MISNAVKGSESGGTCADDVVDDDVDGAAVGLGLALDKERCDSLAAAESAAADVEVRLVGEQFEELLHPPGRDPSR